MESRLHASACSNRSSIYTGLPAAETGEEAGQAESANCASSQAQTHSEAQECLQRKLNKTQKSRPQPRRRKARKGASAETQFSVAQSTEASPQLQGEPSLSLVILC